MKLTLKIIFRQSNEAERVKARVHSSKVDPDPLLYSQFHLHSSILFINNEIE